MKQLADALEALSNGVRLSEAEADQVMDAIMQGHANPVQIAAALTALKVRGETVDELVGFAKAMRRHAVHVPLQRRPVVDTCGTGGDRSFSFNVSTVSSFVVAGAGMAVAKHGNRSATSKSGSADLLEALGVEITSDPAVVGQLIEEVGFGFLFAQSVHTSMRYAAETRKQLGFRTVFNILGPLTNPVQPEFQLLGVFHPDYIRPVAEVLARLGIERAMVVHGAGGLDEISLAGPSEYGLVDNGQIHFGQITPDEMGLPTYSKEAFVGGEPQENAEICYRVLRGESGPYHDMILANAGAALYVAKYVSSVAEGVEMARQTIGNGAALGVLEKLVARKAGGVA